MSHSTLAKTQPTRASNVASTILLSQTTTFTQHPTLRDLSKTLTSFSPLLVVCSYRNSLLHPSGLTTFLVPPQHGGAEWRTAEPMSRTSMLAAGKMSSRQPDLVLQMPLSSTPKRP